LYPALELVVSGRAQFVGTQLAARVRRQSALASKVAVILPQGDYLQLKLLRHGETCRGQAGHAKSRAASTSKSGWLLGELKLLCAMRASRSVSGPAETGTGLGKR